MFYILTRINTTDYNLLNIAINKRCAFFLPCSTTLNNILFMVHSSANSDRYAPHQDSALFGRHTSRDGEHPIRTMITTANCWANQQQLLFFRSKKRSLYSTWGVLDGKNNYVIAFRFTPEIKIQNRTLIKAPKRSKMSRNQVFGDIYTSNMHTTALCTPTSPTPALKWIDFYQLAILLSTVSSFYNNTSGVVASHSQN